MAVPALDIVAPTQATGSSKIRKAASALAILALIAGACLVTFSGNGSSNQSELSFDDSEFNGGYNDAGSGSRGASRAEIQAYQRAARTTQKEVQNLVRVIRATANRRTAVTVHANLRVPNKLIQALNRPAPRPAPRRIVRCPNMRSIHGGRVSCNGNTPGRRCVFSCTHGMAVRGSRIRVCQRNGRWSGGQPRCSMNVHCTNRQASTNHAGVVRVNPPRGYTMVGGGMDNRYRAWNPRGGIFEEMFPEGGRFRCDMGHGPGRLTCYVKACRLPRGVRCINVRRRKHGSGIMQVNCPRGYTMTGGGMNNLYRHWNRHSGFEEVFPHGNGYRCDMGFGSGHFDCYARCCNLPRTHTTCTTRAVASNHAGVVIARCPSGYYATGGGVYNRYRHFNHLSAFEESYPVGNNAWRCDTGFGAGRLTCYVRCCRFR